MFAAAIGIQTELKGDVWTLVASERRSRRVGNDLGSRCGRQRGGRFELRLAVEVGELGMLRVVEVLNVDRVVPVFEVVEVV